MGRGDPALGNILWDGTEARLVDFEDAGRSDVAHEIAEFLEHPQQRNLPAAARERVAAELLAPDEQTALAASRWLLRSFWAVRVPDETSRTRLAELTGAASLRDLTAM